MPLAEPPKALSQHLPQQLQGTLSKGGGSSQVCWARLGHGLTCSSISDTNRELSDKNTGLSEAGGLSWGHKQR